MTDEARATRERLAADLAALGVRPGSVLLVHSSLSALGWVEGGAATVVAGLRQVLGPYGTLLVPALTYASVDASQTRFEQANTPSCVGAISEHFRTHEAQQRSLAPTHSVCGTGPQAAQVLSRHHLDGTPCGPNSPFRAVRDRAGAILFLGCGMRPNTSMHGVEELAEAPYLFGGTYTYRLVDARGQESTARHRHHGFGRWRQRYDRLEPLLTEGSEIRRGHVLEATCYLLRARPMWQRALDAMTADPFFFVERV